jgi:hypothetical protein
MGTAPVSVRNCPLGRTFLADPSARSLVTPNPGHFRPAEFAVPASQVNDAGVKALSLHHHLRTAGTKGVLGSRNLRHIPQVHVTQTLTPRNLAGAKEGILRSRWQVLKPELARQPQAERPRKSSKTN